MNGVNPNHANKVGQTALHIAIDIAFEDAIQRSDEVGERQAVDLFYVLELIQHKADPNLKDLKGESPIDWVYDRTAPEVAERIMKAMNQSYN